MRGKLHSVNTKDINEVYNLKIFKENRERLFVLKLKIPAIILMCKIHRANSMNFRHT